MSQLNSQSNLREICKAIDEKASLVQGLKGFIRQKLESLPANPKASIISGSPRCFTVKSSDVSECWSVGYHDFLTQYKLVADHILTTKDPFQIVAKLEETLSRGSVPDSRGTQRLNPQVIENIRSIMGELK